VPGQRYHSAIVAQAAATLTEMIPDRFYICVGSGQNLNEHITGERWPRKDVRNARLLESVEIMLTLRAGETVTHHGHVVVEDAKLYTRPTTPPKIIVAAITPEAARWVADWADGFITVSHPREQLHKVVDAFREGGGQGKPMYIKVQLSYAESDDAARAGAMEQWATNVLPSPVLADLALPEQFDALKPFVTLPELEPHIRMSADLQRHIEWLNEDIEMGFETINLHTVNHQHERFIHDLGELVLPELRRDLRRPRDRA